MLDVNLSSLPTGTITVPVARGLLKAWGWSQGDLARVLGVSRRSVRRWMESSKTELPQFAEIILLLATDAGARAWLVERFSSTHTPSEANDDVSQGKDI
jgi:transcriptional regulator with XRE-family HTH domain